MTRTELERMVVTLQAQIDPYVKSLKEAERQTQGFAKQVGEQVKSISNEFVKLGAAVAVPMAAVGKISVDAFAQFDQAMTESTSIMNVTEAQVKQMRDVALSLGTMGKHGPAELAKAYYFLASAGLDVQQSIAALPAVSRFATAGVFDLATATDLATGAQSALGLKSINAAVNLKELEHVTDVLAKTAVIAQGSVREFAVAMGAGGGAAIKMANKSIEEGAAVLAVMGDQMIKGEHAGNVFLRFSTLLSQSSRQAAAAHKEFGFAVYDTMGNMRNFADIIEDLERILGPLSPQLREARMEMLGFEPLFAKSIKPLIGMSSKIREYQAALEAAGGTTKEIAEKQMQSFTNQLNLVKNAISTVQIEIGEQLAPALRAVGDILSFSVKQWQAMAPAVRTAIVAIGAGAAAFVGLTASIIVAGKTFNFLFGGIGIVAGTVITAMAGVSLAVGGVVAGLGGIGATLALLRKRAAEAWEWLKPVRTALASLGNAIRDGLVKSWEYVEQAAVRTWEAIAGSANLNWDKIRAGMVDAVLMVEFTLRNFQQVAEATWTAIQLGAVRAVNYVVYGFTEVVPAAIQWAMENWRAITRATWDWHAKALHVLIENTIAIFKNIPWGDLWEGFKRSVQRQIEGATNAFKAIPQIVAGTLTFGQAWGDDAKYGVAVINKELKQLPDMVDEAMSQIKPFVLPERRIGDLEARLQKEWESQRDAIQTSFDEFRRLKLEEFARVGLMPEAAQVAEAARAAGKAGKMMGQEMTAAVEKEVHRLDGALRYSAEALGRFNDYRDKFLVGSTGSIAGPPAQAVKVATAAVAQVAPMLQEVTASLKMDRFNQQVEQIRATKLELQVDLLPNLDRLYEVVDSLQAGVGGIGAYAAGGGEPVTYTMSSPAMSDVSLDGSRVETLLAKIHDLLAKQGKRPPLEISTADL